MIKHFFAKIIKTISSAIREWRCRDPNNEDVDVVRESKYFSVYKGKLVIRKSGFDKRAFSFGALFIPKNEDLGDENFGDLLNHEYGHAVQLKSLGLFVYIKGIAIPSVKSKITDPALYYNQRHEITADLFGDVKRKTHTPEAIEEGLLYMEHLNK